MDRNRWLRWVSWIGLLAWTSLMAREIEAQGQGGRIVECPDSPVLREYTERENQEASSGELRKWRSEKGKFLLLHCARNQISNRVRCIHYHMILAGILNRTLLVPMEPKEVVGGYDLRVVFDVVHARNCFGYSIITTKEYLRKYGTWPTVDKVLCWRGPKGYCDRNAEDLNCPLEVVQSDPEDLGTDVKLRLIKRRFAKQRVEFKEGLELEGACLPLRATINRVVSTYGRTSNAARSNVLIVGDLVEIDVFPARWQPNFAVPLDRAGVPISSPAWKELPFRRTAYCPNRLAVQPDGSIIHAAKGFVAESFGDRPFVAVHWRRGDFKAYCFWHGPLNSCYFPPKQVAWFLRETLAKLGIKDVYLTTNGKQEEVVDLLSSLDKFSNSSVRVVQLPSLGRWKTWMGPVFARRMHKSMRLVQIMVEKMICSLSTVFLGSVASTFSQDIERMRVGLNTYNCNDTTLCFGQKEWVRNRG